MEKESMNMFEEHKVDIGRIASSLGPPGWIKHKFKKYTMEKYRNCGGKAPTNGQFRARFVFDY